jgi:hypothetical protein
MGFGADLASQCNKAKKLKDKFCHELISELVLSVIVKSPVGDPALWKTKAPPGYVGGQFKANWRLGIGSIDGTTSEEIDPDGGATLDNIVGTIPEEAGGKVYFITNSLPYSVRLENGWSNQAPAGIVGLTVIEFSQMVSQAALKVRAL